MKVRARVRVSLEARVSTLSETATVPTVLRPSSAAATMAACSASASSCSLSIALLSPSNLRL